MNFKNGYLLLLSELLMIFSLKKNKKEKDIARLQKEKRDFSSGKTGINFMSVSAQVDYILIKPHKLSR